MEVAKSMYLGGSLIYAKEADFNTCKELGLVCPLCSEAVFLKSGFLRNNRLRNGTIKTQIVPPSFSHYKNDGIFVSDCENRVYSKEGKEIIRHFEIDAKNQRLKLYNKKLWEMYKDHYSITRDTVLRYKKRLGTKYIEAIAIESRKNWAKNLKDIYEWLETTVETLKHLNDKQIEEIEDHFYNRGYFEKRRVLELDPKKHYLKEADYFRYQCNQRLHLAICQEIADFLATRTSGYFWVNLITVQAATAAHHLWTQDIDEIKKYLTKKNLLDLNVKTLCMTHWIDIINKFVNFESKIHR